MYDWVIDEIRRREQEREPQPLHLPIYDDPPPAGPQETEESPAPRGVVIIDL